MLETEIKKLNETMLKNNELLAKLISLQSGTAPTIEPAVVSEMSVDEFSEAVKDFVRDNMDKRQAVKDVIKSFGYRLSKEVEPKDFQAIIDAVHAL